MTRRWAWNGFANQMMVIGLNPSTADETKNDPTIMRCINFAKREMYDGLIMMNAYAFRSTNPEILKTIEDPIGEENNEAISYEARNCGFVIAAWGNHCPDERESEIIRIIGRPIFCFGKNQNGKPKHPLYLRADAPIVKFRGD